MISKCSGCGASNRIPAAHLADAGKCGACKAPLPPASSPIDADVALFDAVLKSAKVPVFVDFWADWCGPCKMAAPEVHKLAADVAGRALVLKVDTEAQPQLAARYSVRSIPNFMVFRNGRPVLQRAGVVSSTEMRRWIESA